MIFAHQKKEKNTMKNIKAKDELGDYGELPAVVKEKIKYSDEPSKVPGLDEAIKKWREEDE